MAKKQPPFKTEAQEAEWWAKNQDLIANRFEQARHHREGHHRGLVDDDDVVRELVAAIVPEAVGGAAAAEQPVECRRRRLE